MPDTASHICDLRISLGYSYGIIGRHFLFYTILFENPTCIILACNIVTGMFVYIFLKELCRYDWRIFRMNASLQGNCSCSLLLISGTGDHCFGRIICRRYFMSVCYLDRQLSLMHFKFRFTILLGSHEFNVIWFLWMNNYALWCTLRHDLHKILTFLATDDVFICCVPEYYLIFMFE